jgi:hypothetical protein
MLMVMAALAVVMGFSQPGHATLTAVGPVNPANGYPQFYTDNAGLSLAPCLDVFDVNAVAAGCVPFDAEPTFNPLNPVVFPTNFPSEFFYWIAEPDFGAATNLFARFALEGAFANEVPAANDQIVFARKRFRIEGFTPGATITITHPFGTDIILDGNADQDGDGLVNGIINVTIDEPAGIPLDFAGVLASNLIGPRLFVGNPLPAALPGYIGDFAASQLVTGGPVRNNITISGGGLNATTALWFVAGKIFANAPGAVSIDRATYSASGTAINLDVFATSTVGAAVTVVGTPVPTPAVPLLEGALGKFFISTPVASVPTAITVSATPAGGGAASLVGASPIPDLVVISRVEYSTSTRVLSINAASSDQRTPGPSLTAVGFGALTGGVGTFPLPPGAIPPATVTVNSSAGGSHTQDVNIVAGGVPAPNPPAGDTVTVTQAVFNSRLAAWTLAGRAGARARVTVSLNGVTVGQATAGATGIWRLVVRNSPVIPGVGASVSAISSLGGSASRAVTIR